MSDKPHFDTLAVRAGMLRSDFQEHSESLTLTSSFVYRNAAEAARRFANQVPLNEPRPELFYSGGANGYTDYPSLPHERQSPDLNSSHARVNDRVSSGV